MKCVLLLLACVASLDLCWGLTSYLPSDMPNPQMNPVACGLEDRVNLANAQPRLGYLCDPERILTKDQRNNLDEMLHVLANIDDPNLCPCSQYHCDNYQGARFYKVAIALIPRLRLPLDTNNRTMTPLSQAQSFAYQLEHNLWRMGSCEEDIVILYSPYDKALVTMTGHVAGRRLDGRTRNILHSIVGQDLADGRIDEGLRKMVYELRMVLRGNNYYNVQQAQTGGSHRALLPTSLILLATALATVFTS